MSIEKYYKEVLLNAGVNIDDDGIKIIKNVINRANAFGCGIDIYGIANILSPPKLNAAQASKLLFKTIEGSNIKC